MKEKLYFTDKDSLLELNKNKTGIFNFQNLYSVWLFKNEPKFREEILKKPNIIFPDGKILSLFLRIKQQRGPTFTREFLMSEIAKTKKHFFIGNTNSKEISEKTKISEKNIQIYLPPFIKELEFSKQEKQEILKKFKKFKPDYIWVCIGNPKQEILANNLYEEHPSKYLNVGAALDFLLDKKKESPKLFRSFGLEWFYRLITDFKYSKKKVWRSFIGLFYLPSSVRLRK